MTDVLVIGATGVFGSRLCERLARIEHLDLIVTSRDDDRARRLAERLHRQTPALQVTGAALRIDDTLARTLNKWRPHLVIHAAGPFQGQSYHVAEACLAAGAHYIDLADSTDFVVGFKRLDAVARSAGRLAVTGASSVPGLSSVVVDSLAAELRSVDMIETGIAPGNRTPRGRAVVEAILGYAGQAIPAWRENARTEAVGWLGLRRKSVPGLGSRWFSDCDVPDLILFPKRYRVRDIRFGASLELSLLHLGLWGLSGLRRARLLPNLSHFAAMLHHLAGWFEGLGTDCGAMYVEVTGKGKDGLPSLKTWSLVAKRGHGPYVPILPAVILARKLAEGSLTRTGAMPCLGLFTLQEFEAEVDELDITMCQS